MNVALRIAGEKRFWNHARMGLVLATAIALMSAGFGHVQAADGAKIPRIVKTSPECGATDVDPALTEIRVTFDQDMRSGMSWTGAGQWLPPVDKARKAQWIDKRTCVLPVTLAEGRYYRVGINSSSFQNFQSQAGEPAPSAAIYFATRGADAETAALTQKPRIVQLEPAQQAQDVDPATTELRVTFNVPMDTGMSWTGSGEHYPRLAEGKQPRWSDDGLTCILPVTLEAGREYAIGLNSLHHNNFQSRSGVPLEPVEYRFRTKE